MSRILLVHWNAAEANERATTLRAAGHTVVVHYKQADTEGFKRIRANPPDVAVIGLSRIPSHGREVGSWLRRNKSTRDVPLVFAGGEPENVAKTKELLPDAEYATWRGIRGAVKRALARKPADKPVVPGAMAGYSGTPLPKKLGIKAGSRVALLRAPKDFERTLGTLPDDVTIRRQARGLHDVVILFAKSVADLAARFDAATKAVADGGSIWIAWPKQASGVETDLTQNHVRRYGLDRNWVDYKIAAIDETWSGLRFARRK